MRSVQLTQPELIRWTKGFGAPNIEGHDVAAMFASSLKRLVSIPFRQL
jgi:hexokinase